MVVCTVPTGLSGPGPYSPEKVRLNSRRGCEHVNACCRIHLGDYHGMARGIDMFIQGD